MVSGRDALLQLPQSLRPAADPATATHPTSALSAAQNVEETPAKCVALRGTRRHAVAEEDESKRQHERGEYLHLFIYSTYSTIYIYYVLFESIKRSLFRVVLQIYFVVRLGFGKACRWGTDTLCV